MSKRPAAMEKTFLQFLSVDGIMGGLLKGTSIRFWPIYWNPAASHHASCYIMFQEISVHWHGNIRLITGPEQLMFVYKLAKMGVIKRTILKF